MPNRLLQLVTGCARDIAGTLLRFAAYCAVIGGAVFGAWMLVLSLFIDEEGPDTTPRTTGATPVLWLEQDGPPSLRRLPD